MKKLLLLTLTLLISELATAQFEKDFFPVDTANSDYNSETGKFIKYHKNGQVAIDGTLKYGVLHDSCTFYYENGNLYQKGVYYYGKPIGKWREYTIKEVELIKMFSQKPDERRRPEESELKKETTDEYVFSYPNNWIIVGKDVRGADFFLLPWDTFGPFKDNMNIIKMPIRKEFRKLDNFGKLLKQQFSSQYPNSKIVTEKDASVNGTEAKDIIVELTAPNGLTVTNWTRYFVTKQYAFQISMICEPSQFERRSVDFEQILTLFRLK